MTAHVLTRMCQLWRVHPFFEQYSKDHRQISLRNSAGALIQSCLCKTML